MIELPPTSPADSRGSAPVVFFFDLGGVRVRLEVDVEVDVEDEREGEREGERETFPQLWLLGYPGS